MTAVVAAARPRPAPLLPAVTMLLVTALTACMALEGATRGRPTTVLIATLLLWGALVLWSVATARRAYVFCGFLVVWFVFLLARPAIVLAFGPDPAASTGLLGTNFRSAELVTRALTLAYLSLAGLGAGAALHDAVRRPRDRAEDPPAAQEPSPQRSALRRWALVLFCLTAPLQALTYWDRSRSVASVGFYELRVESVSALPGFVSFLGAMAPVACFAFLATRPSRRSAAPVLLAFLLLGTLSLATWQRADFVLTVLFLIMYAVHRQWTARDGETWIRGRTAVLLALAAVPAAALLRMLGEVRGRGPAETSYPLFGMLDFLYTQGVSVNVLGYALAFEDAMPPGRMFSIGPAVEFLTWNVGSALGLAEVPTGQSLERVTQGHQLSHTLSYLIMPGLYLQGSGYGSSFVAELWLDGGLPLLFLGSAVLGVFLMAIPRLLASPNMAVAALALMIVYELFFVPRGAFVGFLVAPLSLPSLAAALVLALAVVLTVRPRAGDLPPGDDTADERRRRDGSRAARLRRFRHRRPPAALGGGVAR